MLGGEVGAERELRRAARAGKEGQTNVGILYRFGVETRKASEFLTLAAIRSRVRKLQRQVWQRIWVCGLVFAWICTPIL